MKLVIDFVMTILMLVEMAYRFTGNLYHELLGISLFVLFIVHNILNRQWYNTIFKGKMNVRRIMSITVNLLLDADMVALFISSVPISRTIFAFVHIENVFIARQIHIFAAYWALIFISVHLGMHWPMIIGGIGRIAGTAPRNSIHTIVVLRIFTLLIVIFGVHASFHRNIGSRLILYYTFDFWNSEESFIKFFIDYLSIMGIYIWITHYALKLFKKTKVIK